MKKIYLAALIGLTGLSAAPAHAVNPVEGALLLGVPCAAGAVVGMGIEGVITRGRSPSEGAAGASLGCMAGMGAALGYVAHAEAAPSEEQLNTEPAQNESGQQGEE